MDPASLAFGIVGVAVPVVKSTFAAIHIILKIRDLPKDQKHLAVTLDLEEKRLHSWCKHAGLTVYETEGGKKKVLESGAFGPQRGLVFDLLMQINVLFDDFKEHQNRHKRLGSKEDKVNLADIIQKSGRAEFIGDWVKTLSSNSQDGWKRLRWATWDKAEFERLIDTFRKLNDSVTSLLDSQIQNEIAKTTQETYREVLQLTTRIDQLQQLIYATEFRGSGAEVEGMKTLRALTAFKRYYIEQTEAATAAKKIETTSIDVLDSDGASRLDPTHQRPRSKGMYRKYDKRTEQNVWIEWMKYKKSTSKEGPPEKITEQVKKLSSLLYLDTKPTEFRVPRCLGYFEVQPATEGLKYGELGFVFEPPNDTDRSLLPRSLMQILQDPEMSKPSITERVALAHALANSLLFLHSVDWLHKGLRPDNILFFTEQGKHGKIDFANPTVSGFDVARPVVDTQHTQEANADIETRMYRHPKSLDDETEARESYRKTFDIYSLGLIFLELAYWMPIDKVLEKFDRIRWQKMGKSAADAATAKCEDIFTKKEAAARPVQVKGIIDKLFKRGAVDSVPGEMGAAYHDVVFTCLSGGKELNLEERDNEALGEIGAKMGDAFFKKVVRKLEEIKI